MPRLPRSTMFLKTPAGRRGSPHHYPPTDPSLQHLDTPCSAHTYHDRERHRERPVGVLQDWYHRIHLGGGKEQEGNLDSSLGDQNTTGLRATRKPRRCHLREPGGGPLDRHALPIGHPMPLPSWRGSRPGTRGPLAVQPFFTSLPLRPAKRTTNRPGLYVLEATRTDTTSGGRRWPSALLTEDSDLTSPCHGSFKGARDRPISVGAHLPSFLSVTTYAISFPNERLPPDQAQGRWGMKGGMSFAQAFVCRFDRLPTV